MSDPELTSQLAELFQETFKAHHHAFSAADGADPEWPIWYAGYLHEKLQSLLSTEITQSQLIYLLVAADRAYQRDAPSTPWPNYYATYFLENQAV